MINWFAEVDELPFLSSTGEVCIKILPIGGTKPRIHDQIRIGRKVWSKITRFEQYMGLGNTVLNSSIVLDRNSSKGDLKPMSTKLLFDLIEPGQIIVGVQND